MDEFSAGVGTEYVFHLDTFGKIAYVSKAEARRMKYAYIIKGTLSEDDEANLDAVLINGSIKTLLSSGELDYLNIELKK